MQLAIRYGQEYIGSETKVILSSNFDVILAIRYRDICTFEGYGTMLKEFIEGIGHKVIMF